MLIFTIEESFLFVNRRKSKRICSIRGFEEIENFLAITDKMEHYYGFKTQKSQQISNCEIIADNINTANLSLTA